MAVSKAKKEPADKDAPKAAGAKEEQHIVMLGNDCQRYMTPSGKIYEAGKKYSVSAAQRKALFREYDENGIRYFYDAEEIMRQIAAARRKGRRLPEGMDRYGGELDTGARAAAQAEEDEQQEEETGAIKLEDDEGQPVGTKGDSVSI